MTPVSVKMAPVQPVDLRGPFFFVPREGRERLPSRPGTVILDLEDSVTREELPARRQPNMRAALRQAIEASPDGRLPIAVVRDDRAAPTVTLLLDDFLDLVGEWWELRSR